MFQKKDNDNFFKRRKKLALKNDNIKDTMITEQIDNIVDYSKFEEIIKNDNNYLVENFNKKTKIF